MKLYQVTDSAFQQYGRVLDMETGALIAEAEKIPLPESGSIYEAGTAAFEALSVKDELQNETFGGMEIQIGYCYGHNDALGALEWHKSSEINVAVTDMILFLGSICEMEGSLYHSDHVKAFLVKRGTAIEVYATTLHFCPCETSKDGFGSVVVLPKGTNLPLEAVPKDKHLFRKNKWLLAHPDNTNLVARGAVPGIIGKNLKVGIDV